MKYLLTGILIIVTGVLFSADLKIIYFPVTNETKIKGIEEYCKVHYGQAIHTMSEPKIIVIHYTGIPDTRECLNYFKPDILEASRKEIAKFGLVNVGIHYVVGEDGSAYSLYPENEIARHVIGLNYCALGIENAGISEKSLTDNQLKTDTELIVQMLQRHPSIEYLIGHLEYNNRKLPHYVLFKEAYPEYARLQTPDPGANFMKRLRKNLKDRGIVLKE